MPHKEIFVNLTSDQIAKCKSQCGFYRGLMCTIALKQEILQRLPDLKENGLQDWGYRGIGNECPNGYVITNGVLLNK